MMINGVFRLRKIFWRSLLCTTLLICKFAYAAPCAITEGSFSYTVSYDLDSRVNEVGSVLGWQEKTATGSYHIGGGCTDPNKPVYWSASPAEGMIYAGSLSDGSEWYSIPGNEYLQVATKIAVWDHVAGTNRYYNVPFQDISNKCGSDGPCGGAASTGSKVSVNLRISNPFIGKAFINREIAFLSGNSVAGEVSRIKMVGINLTAQITVPESCALDEGQTITFNFGNIGATAFSKAGPGNKPAGVNPQTHTISIKCKNIDAQALLTLRLEAKDMSGNAMVSDNPDLGFIVADKNHNPLIPNDFDSKIPFKLDSNAEAAVPVIAWPVSITGKTPAEGKFSAEGYLRMDFD